MHATTLLKWMKTTYDPETYRRDFAVYPEGLKAVSNGTVFVKGCYYSVCQFKASAVGVMDLIGLAMSLGLAKSIPNHWRVPRKVASCTFALLTKQGESTLWLQQSISQYACVPRSKMKRELCKPDHSCTWPSIVFRNGHPCWDLVKAHKTYMSLPVRHDTKSLNKLSW